MSNSIKFVIAILAVGILIGAATTTNLALAQLQSPLQQRPLPPATSVNKVSIVTTSVQSQPVNIGPGNTGTAHVECPSGTVVTGGGYNSNIGTVVFGSLMNSINGWVVNAFNPSSTITIQLIASATCASLQ